MADVTVANVTLRYPGAVPAGLFDCSLSVDNGQILTVIGPSGSGKTTLLRLVAGLERPNSGSVVIGGRNVTSLAPANRDLALIPQRPILYPHLSVLRNLSIGLEMRQSRGPKVPPSEVRRRVDEAVTFLGLQQLLERRPFQLSGGEMQRVALGRVLVRRPAVWLLDEPFSHLDAPRKLQFRRELILLRGLSPATMIVVTHDPDEAVSLGQRLAVLDSGRVRQVGSPMAVAACPMHRRVAELVGQPAMNFVHGALAADGPSLRFAAADGTILLPVPAELVTHGAEGQPVAVGIRPEDLSPVPIAASAPPLHSRAIVAGWQVRLVELFPPRRLITVGRGRWLWSYWEPENTTLGVGEQVSLALDLGKSHWFDGDGNRLPTHAASQAVNPCNPGV